jgi:hypothetical protein
MTREENVRLIEELNAELFEIMSGAVLGEIPLTAAKVRYVSLLTSPERMMLSAGILANQVGLSMLGIEDSDDLPANTGEDARIVLRAAWINSETGEQEPGTPPEELDATMAFIVATCNRDAEGAAALFCSGTPRDSMPILSTLFDLCYVQGVAFMAEDGGE